MVRIRMDTKPASSQDRHGSMLGTNQLLRAIRYPKDETTSQGDCCLTTCAKLGCGADRQKKTPKSEPIHHNLVWTEQTQILT